MAYRARRICLSLRLIEESLAFASAINARYRSRGTKIVAPRSFAFAAIHTDCIRGDRRCQGLAVYCTSNPAVIIPKPSPSPATATVNVLLATLQPAQVAVCPAPVEHDVPSAVATGEVNIPVTAPADVVEIVPWAPHAKANVLLLSPTTNPVPPLVGTDVKVATAVAEVVDCT